MNSILQNGGKYFKRQEEIQLKNYQKKSVMSK